MNDIHRVLGNAPGRPVDVPGNLMDASGNFADIPGILVRALLKRGLFRDK